MDLPIFEMLRGWVSVMSPRPFWVLELRVAQGQSHGWRLAWKMRVSG